MKNQKLKSPCNAIIGLGFGDEGKGLVTGNLAFKAKERTIIIRYSGGPQAAHRVVTKSGLEKVFSIYGSGTFFGADTYLSEDVAVNPIIVRDKARELEKLGIKTHLIINPKCPIITPFDSYFNQNDTNSLAHGTCGHGVWTTFLREINKYSLLYEDIFNETIFEIKLKLIKEYYENKLNSYININLEMKRAIKFMRDNKNISIEMFPKKYEHIIFESSQGLLLDRYNGFYPHITSSSVGTKNILKLGYKPSIFLVTRAYQTKHGNGPMTNQDLQLDFKLHDGEKNVHNKFQGEFKVSVLDLDLLKYGIHKDEHISRTDFTLVITCLDHIQNNNYQFTLDQKLYTFSNYRTFASAIQMELNVPDVLLSFDEYSENLTKL